MYTKKKSTDPNESPLKESEQHINDRDAVSNKLSKLDLDSNTMEKDDFPDIGSFEFEFFEDMKLYAENQAEVNTGKEKSTTYSAKTKPTHVKKKHAYSVATNWLPKWELDFDLPFKPDTFQLQAFFFLKHNKSILVTAHTSSGKTTIVDYAIFLSQKHKTKVIYTSPIKALSNQKYNEFKKYNPGIITGDVSLNTSSNILIMTTEILRNLLYSRSPLLSDLEFVVFDEVHYINNRDRGVIWEECIIMLPKYITIAMLSACIPNALDFGSWVGRIRESEIYVIETLKRVIPLDYYICEKEEIRALQINSEKKGEQTSKQQHGKAQNIKKPYTDPEVKSVSKNIVSTRRKNNLLYIINYIVKHNLTPCIIFCFSKRKCHEHAKRIIKPYIREFEKKKILEIIKTKFDNKIAIEDRSLPQIVELKNYLINGVAIHHSGLLPILKELIEILFSAGLVKILFATETFSMGVNFPAKSVVFLSLKKMDDKMRVLLPGEFMQMSGRAGRRGIDKRGIVIVNYEGERLDDNIEFTVRKLIKSRCALHSKFKLTYNMILQFLRSKIKVEDILKMSFCEESVQKDLGHTIVILSRLERIYKSITSNRYGAGENITNVHVLDCNMCSGIREFVDGWNAFFITNNAFIRYYLKSTNNIEDKILITNDMTRITFADLDDTNKQKKKYYIDNFDFTKYYRGFVKFHKKENSKVQNRANKVYTTDNILYLEQNDIPFFDYGMNDIDSTLKLLEIKEIFTKLSTSVCTNCPNINIHYSQMIDIMMLEQKIDDIKKIFDEKSLILFEDYLEKLTFLIDHKYIDTDHNLLLKGQLACEIKTVDEIVITECLINNLFEDMSVSDILAFVSMIITKEESREDFQNKTIMRIIGEIQKVYDFKFYSAYFLPVKQWCEGKSFSEIIICHGVSEGIFIRTILRLDEFCAEILNCCTILEDKELYDRIDETRKTLKRDILSCNSLYFD